MKLTPQQQDELVLARQIIPPARARDVIRLKSWEHGMCLERGSVKPDVLSVSAEEEEAVRRFWKSLPDWTNWMTAIYLLARE